MTARVARLSSLGQLERREDPFEQPGAPAARTVLDDRSADGEKSRIAESCSSRSGSSAKSGPGAVGGLSQAARIAANPSAVADAATNRRRTQLSTIVVSEGGRIIL